MHIVPDNLKNAVAKNVGNIRLVLRWLGENLIVPVLFLVFVSPIIAIIAGVITGPSSYRIYFIGDFADPKVSGSWPEFQASLSRKDIDGVPIELTKIDAGSSEAAEISKIVADSNDAIFVVGHFNSTASAKALFKYLSASPPIPVILPVESNPDLVPSGFDKKFTPVFQLVPTDDEQAKKAAEFAQETGAQRIWVIEDTTSNPVYAHYLASEFIKNIQSQYGEKEYLGNCDSRLYDCKTAKKWSSEKYHARVVLRTAIMSPPSRDLLNALKIDWIFLASSEDNCLLVSRQIAELWKENNTRPTLLAGKGCERDLTSEGNVMVSDAFMTHHLSALDFHSPKYNGQPGVEAADVLRQILEDAQSLRAPFSDEMGFFDSIRFIFKLHRAGDVRLSLARAMEKAVDVEKFQLQAPTGQESVAVSFRKDGRVAGKSFRVWQLKKESDGLKFVDLNGMRSLRRD